MPKIKFKPFVINFLIALLLLGAHVLALFSSPTFLGTDYSIKTLIDDYCASNLDGGSIIFNSTVTNSDDVLNKVVDYKNINDVNLNTVLGLSVNDAEFDGMPCSLVGSTPHKDNSNFNLFRVYSDDNWKLLNQDNSIFISESMGMSLVPREKNPKDYRTIVRNKAIDVKINDSTYSFKIVGFYNTTVANGEWRSRGRYFNESLSNCIFINETFLHDKFSNVFQMFTSDTVDSGAVFKRYESLINLVGGDFSTPTNTTEAEILNKIGDLNNKTNVLKGLALSITSPIILFVSLMVSICLFDVKYLFKKFKWLTLIWCLLYLLLSYGFVFVTRNMIISLFGFNALGANKASLSMMSIYTFLLVVGILIKFLLHSKKQNKNRIIRYNI